MRIKFIERYAAILGIALSFSVLCVNGCDGKRDSASTAATFKVGSVLFLTGPAASYGEMQKAGFQIALDEINGAGGINGKPLEVVYEDSAHSEPKAVAAVKKLVTQDGVPLIVEVTGSGEAVAVAPVATEQKVAVLSAIDSAEKLSGISEYFFRIMPSDAFQGAFLADWGRELNWKKAAILYVNNEWGVGMRDSVQRRFVQSGGEVVSSEGSSDGDIDLRAQLTKIKDAAPDGVFLLLYPQAAGRAMKQARDLGVRGPFMGGDALSGEEVVSAGGDAADGLMFCLPANGTGSAFQSFDAKYRQRFGKAPSIYAIKSYDAMKIAAAAIRTNGYTVDGIRSYLRELKDFDGASGLITLDAKGDIVSQKFDRLIYQNGKYVPASQQASPPAKKAA